MMKTQITITVRDLNEAAAIERALEDKVFHASAVLIGLLKPLSHRARKRNLVFVMDHLDEERELLEAADADSEDEDDAGRED